MSIEQSRKYPPRRAEPDYNDCGEKDYPTQIVIKQEKIIVCNKLYESASEVSKQEKKFEGESFSPQSL